VRTTVFAELFLRKKLVELGVLSGTKFLGKCYKNITTTAKATINTLLKY